MAGSGLHHRGPGKCACRGWPAQYTTGFFLEARATHPPAVPHHKGYPQEGQQGFHHRLPGLQCHACLTDITMLQWTRDVPPPQVPQALLRQEEEEEEEEGCEPCWEELQPKGMQGWWLPLGRHLPTALLFR